MTSNDQSLFNYIKNMENKLINTPHKSATDELLVYKFFDKQKKIFKVRRTQNFRIHTLDLEAHNTFPLNTQMIMNKSKHFTVKEFKKNFKFILKINNKIVSSIYTKAEFNKCINSLISNNGVHITFKEEKGTIRISIEKNLVLKTDFTDIEIITERLEPNEGSFGLLANVASYIYEAKFVFPECVKITNLYHDRTIYTSNNKELKLDAQFDNNIATFVNKNWQLPGLIVTLTFE